MGAVQAPSAKDTFLKEISESGTNKLSTSDGHPVWETLTQDELVKIRGAEKSWTSAKSEEKGEKAQELWDALTPIHSAYEDDIQCRPEYQLAADAANPVYRVGSAALNFRSNGFQLAPWTSIRAYGRWSAFNVTEQFPTIFYDKLFTRSYLPFRTRYSTGLVLAIFVGYKMWARCPCMSGGDPKSRT
jgi:hypothetical protein